MFTCAYHSLILCKNVSKIFYVNFKHSQNSKKKEKMTPGKYQFWFKTRYYRKNISAILSSSEKSHSIFSPSSETVNILCLSFGARQDDPPNKCKCETRLSGARQERIVKLMIHIELRKARGAGLRKLLETYSGPVTGNNWSCRSFSRSVFVTRCTLCFI